MPRMHITEDEHKLIIRYREQARAFNEGIAAALVALSHWEGNLVKPGFETGHGIEKLEWDSMIADVVKQKKDTP